MVHFNFVLIAQLHTFHCPVYHDRPGHRPFDHDDRHFRKCHPHPDVNAYAKNDAMNVVHAIHDHEHVHDVYDVQMYEVNVVDGLDDDFVLDVYTFHIQSDFHRRNVDDIDYYMTEV